jgi:PAS domain S-box-containing protein
MIQAESVVDSKIFPRAALGLLEHGIEATLGMVGAGVWAYLLPENRYVHSDGAYRLVGADPEVARSRPDFWPSRVHPEDAAALVSAFSDFLQAHDSTFEKVYRVRHEAGHFVSLMVRARWVPRSDGREGRCALGFSIDLTARSRDLDHLQAREERFRMSLAALRGVVYDMDLRTGKVERHGLKRVFGYDTLDDSGAWGGWLALIHPEDQDDFRKMALAYRARASNFELTYRVRHQDGRWLNVRQVGTYILGLDGTPIRALGVVEDVTQAHELDKKVQLQAAIIERLSEGVMLLQRDGTILFANPAFEKLFGYERGELNGWNAQLLSFRSSANFEGLMRAVFEGTTDNRTSIIDLEGRRRDGTMCPIQGFFSSMMLGQTRCVVAVANDISERKLLEREIMQVATRVQQRIGGDLHDGLGQQLAGIAMMLQALGQRVTQEGKSSLSGELEDVVKLVNEAIHSTRSLARGLSPVRPSREGLLEGFEELVNQIQERYRIRVQPDLRLPEGLALDENTATNIYRIAQEGVLNAARHADADQILLRLSVVGSDVELLIIDDGEGFDPLQVIRGGMGLRIMRFRAQLIGGYVSVESRPGAGTTLRCRCQLPASKEAA